VDGENIRRFIEDSGVSVIVAGGVRGIEDILLLQTIPGVSGVILGKVLYTGRVSFREILERAGGRQC